MKTILFISMLLALGCGDTPIKKSGPSSNTENNSANNTQPNNTQPNNTQPNNTQSNNTQPNNTQPNNTQPNNTQPNNTQPNNTQPNNTQPNNTQPNNFEMNPDGTLNAPISFVLVWENPNAGESGVDLDLHVAHPNGVTQSTIDRNGDGINEPWGIEPWDCHWRNKKPDWGPPGPAGDPSLDIDAIAGYGPESVSILTPEPILYHVGATVYNDRGTGTTFATLRIFQNDELVYEESNVPLESKDFWEAGVFNARTGEFTSYSESGGLRIIPNFDSIQ